MSQSRLQLRERARQRADQERSTFVSDAELNIYLQQSWYELYDILVSRFEDYYSQTLTTTVGAGSSEITLPADLYKLRGVDYQLDGTTFATLRQFNFLERNKRARNFDRLIAGRRNIVYRMMGNKLLLLPEQDAAGTYRLWYIPRCPTLSSDSSVVDNVLDFDEYIVVDAAIKMMVKEESDPAALLLEKQALKARIESMAAGRNAGEPMTVQDVVTSDMYAELLIPRG
jgi:hypothetical protein